MEQSKTASERDFLINVLSEMPQITVNWNNVVAKKGASRKDHATSLFKHHFEYKFTEAMATGENWDFIACVLGHTEMTIDWKAVTLATGYSRPDKPKLNQTTPERIFYQIYIYFPNSHNVNIMAESPDKAAATLSFVLDCLACSKESLGIDFNDAAAKVGQAYARNVQTKFKKIIEASGKYQYANGKITDISDPNAAPAPTPSRRGRGGKATSTPRATANKRKTANANEDTDDEAATPVKKKQRTTPAKRQSTKKAAAKVKEEDENDSNVEDGENNDDATENSDNEDEIDDMETKDEDVDEI